MLIRLHQNAWFLIFLYFFSIISPALADDKPQPGAPVKLVPVQEDGRATQASFSDVSDIEVEENIMEYRTGSEDQLKTKTPKVSKNPTVNQKQPPSPIQNPPQTSAANSPTPTQTAYKQPNIPYTNTDLHVDMGSLIDREQTKKDPMRAYHAYAEVFHSGYTTEGHERLDD